MQVARHPEAPGVILKRWRESLRVAGRDVSVRSLARMLSVAPSTISRLERPMDPDGLPMTEKHRLALWYLARELRVELPLPLRPYVQ